MGCSGIIPEPEASVATGSVRVFQGQGEKGRLAALLVSEVKRKSPGRPRPGMMAQSAPTGEKDEAMQQLWGLACSTSGSLEPPGLWRRGCAVWLWERVCC